MADSLHSSQWKRVAINVHNFGEVKQLVLTTFFSLIVLYISWHAWHIIYNLYFHPLAKFPGPKLAAISPLWNIWCFFGGRWPYDVLEAHQKYGPIMRVAPNELSFSDVGAWKDIHGNHPRDKTFVKSDIYNTDEKAYGARHIVSENDIGKHAEMRRMLAPAFSTKALMEQENIIQNYVNLLVQRLGQRYADKERGPDGEYCNIVNWYNYTTFDIIGDLAFGDATAFACLTEQKPHPWIEIILSGIFVSCLNGIFKIIPGGAKLGYWLTPESLKESRRRWGPYATNLVAKRLETLTDRKDFWHYILNREESKGKSVQELSMQAQVLIIAGSETTATALSGLTYYLLKTPRVYNILKEEVRTSFQRFSDITAASTLPLTYLNAVIEEGLRLYPPVPGGSTRVSPGATVAGHYIPKGAELGIHHYSITHNPKYWSKPYEMIPERWIDPNTTDTLEASQPFQLGPRGCLGKSLAYMELRLILAKVVYAYDFELVDKTLDWEEKSRAWGLWWKPDLHTRITKRPGLQWMANELPV